MSLGEHVPVIKHLVEKHNAKREAELLNPADVDAAKLRDDPTDKDRRLYHGQAQPKPKSAA